MKAIQYHETFLMKVTDFFGKYCYSFAWLIGLLGTIAVGIFAAYEIVKFLIAMN